MITKKYYIMFDNCEVDLSEWIRITAVQYWTEMKKFDKIIEETKDDENCGQAWKHTAKKIESEKEDRYMDYLGFGTATVYLCRTECKPGFKYSKKGR